MDKMAYFVCVVGALTAAWAITVLFKPDWMKKGIVFFQKGRMVYLVIGLKNTIGIIFLIFARECRWTVFIIIVGVLMISGTTLFCMPSRSWPRWAEVGWMIRPTAGLNPTRWSMLDCWG